MKNPIVHLTILILLAVPSFAQSGMDQTMLEQVYIDAQVIKRIAEVAHRDLPRDLLKRIVEQDVEMLRGKQTDGTYTNAHFEPIESGRVSEGFSVREGGEDGAFDRNQFRAKNVFKLIVDIPSRRLLVARNRDIFLERIEVSYEDQEGNPKSETYEVGRRVEAGEKMEFELPEVASDAIATVYANSESKSANMELIFVKAELVDNADSPYFGVVQSAKLLGEAIDRRDQTAMQSLASSMAGRVDTFLGRASLPPIIDQTDVAVPPVEIAEEPLDSIPLLEIYLQLERIEDLLTGSDRDRMDGMDRLHDLIRDLRSEALDSASRR